VIVVILLRFSSRDYHSAIFGHVSKVVTFVTFHFSAQRFKPIATSSLCFTRPSWITLLCMTFKVVYVPVVSSAIHNFMSKISTCIKI
jgi:hypothetical protein